MVRASQVHGVKRPAPHPDPECNGEDEGEYRKGHIDARKCDLTDAVADEDAVDQDIDGHDHQAEHGREEVPQEYFLHRLL